MASDEMRGVRSRSSRIASTYKRLTVLTAASRREKCRKWDRKGKKIVGIEGSHKLLLFLFLFFFFLNGETGHTNFAENIDYITKSQSSPWLHAHLL